MTPRILVLLVATSCAVDDVSVTTAESELGATITVDYPGALSTLLLGNNDLGRYVGLYVDTAHVAHAMRFDGHAMVPIELGGARSRAYATNNLGDVVGSYSDATGDLHGFRLHHGTVTTIDVPGGAPTEIYGINDLGRMIGVSYDEEGNSHGFSLFLGQFRDLDISDSTIPLSINDLGVVVGEDIDGTTARGYRQARNGSVTTYDDDTYFASINNRGHVLGAHFDGRTFLLAGGVETLIEVPGVAQTLNDRGDIVGYFADAAGTHGFIVRGH